MANRSKCLRFFDLCYMRPIFPCGCVEGTAFPAAEISLLQDRWDLTGTPTFCGHSEHLPHSPGFFLVDLELLGDGIGVIAERNRAAYPLALALEGSAGLGYPAADDFPLELIENAQDVDIVSDGFRVWLPVGGLPVGMCFLMEVHWFRPMGRVLSSLWDFVCRKKRLRQWVIESCPPKPRFL